MSPYSLPSLQGLEPLREFPIEAVPFLGLLLAFAFSF